MYTWSVYHGFEQYYGNVMKVNGQFNRLFRKTIRAD